MEGEVRIALMEQKIDTFDTILSKLDSTIDKLSEVNSNVIKMLAVHEEKVAQSEKTDDIIIKLVGEANKRIDEIQKEVKEVQRTRWVAIGIGSILVIIFTAAVQSFKMSEPAPIHPHVRTN